MICILWLWGWAFAQVHSNLIYDLTDFDLFFSFITLLLCLQLDEVDDCIVLRQLLQTNSDLIYESGYVKPIANTTVSDKNEIWRAVLLHQAIFHSMAEWEQLRRGLNVLDEIQKPCLTFLHQLTIKRWTKIWTIDGWTKIWTVDIWTKIWKLRVEQKNWTIESWTKIWKIKSGTKIGLVNWTIESWTKIWANKNLDNWKIGLVNWTIEQKFG